MFQLKFQSLFIPALFYIIIVSFAKVSKAWKFTDLMCIALPAVKRNDGYFEVVIWEHVTRAQVWLEDAHQ